MDPRFRVEVISATPNPQQTIYAGMHQDYAEGFVFDGELPDESKAGELAVRNLLKGGRGHFGPLEHPQITFNCGWFPHSTMQQLRTHRVGVSFDVQSFRYTGTRIADLGKFLYKNSIDGYWGDRDSAAKLINAERPDLINAIEEVFYLRPIGSYTNRSGKKYEYGAGKRYTHLWACADRAVGYLSDIEDGLSEEHARGFIPFDVRQHWILSANARSLMHLLDLRWKADAQLEAQQLCELIWPHFKAWVPEIAQWYEDNRMKKARLSP